VAYRDVILADSPSAYMRLGEPSGTTCNDEIGGTAGTYSGTFTLAAAGLLNGDRDTAATFRTNGKAQFADRAAFDLGDRFTLEAWITLSALGRNQCIGDKGSGAYIFRVHSDNRLLLRRNGNLDIAKSTITLTTGIRYHVVATKDGATIKLWVDAVDVTGTVTNQTMTNNSIAFGIGAADAGTTDFFSGTIDEVAVYPIALSAGQVLAHYEAGTHLRGTSSLSAAVTCTSTGTKAAASSTAMSLDAITSSAGTKSSTGSSSTSVAVSASSTGTKAGIGSLRVSADVTVTSTGTKAAFGSSTATASATVTSTGVAFHPTPPPPDLPTRVTLDPHTTTVTANARRTIVLLEGHRTRVLPELRETAVTPDG
jgi:hypothetical protein